MTSTEERLSEAEQRLLLRVLGWRVRVGVSGCWEWVGVRDRGYGRVKHNGKTRIAHRWVYEVAKGDIAAGLTLDHLCCNTSCVNPDHLQPVTLAVNLSRSVHCESKVTTCPHGHDYTAANTYSWRGKRICRACRRNSKRLGGRSQSVTIAPKRGHADAGNS